MDRRKYQYVEQSNTVIKYLTTDSKKNFVEIELYNDDDESLQNTSQFRLVTEGTYQITVGFYYYMSKDIFLEEMKYTKEQLKFISRDDIMSYRINVEDITYYKVGPYQIITGRLSTVSDEEPVLIPYYSSGTVSSPEILELFELKNE